MLRRRLKDEKVNVRKAAVQTLEAAIRFQMPNCVDEVSGVIYCICYSWLVKWSVSFINNIILHCTLHFILHLNLILALYS